MMSRRTLLLLAPAAGLAICLAATAGQKVLYETESPYTTILVTEDDDGLRTLSFERYGARQSVVKVGDPDHIELPYARTMLSGLALVEEPKRVLIVGLGGGTIPSFLHKHYPRSQIDVVDIDPEVVRVAKRFFGFHEDAFLHAHVEDGRRFIEECRTPYDLIFLDAFSSENIPRHLATREFLLAVRRALTPEGVALGNIWSRGSNPLYDSMVRTYQEVFDQLCILDVRGAGNKILVAPRRKRPINKDQFARQAGVISREKAFRFDMGELVEYGYRLADEPAVSGQVLTDNDQLKKAG